MVANRRGKSPEERTGVEYPASVEVTLLARLDTSRCSSDPIIQADRVSLVLVQPEMERGRFPLVSIRPCGRGFSRHEGLPVG